MVVVLPEGFRSLKRTLARLDPDEKLTISVIYPCFPWFSFDALGLFYESRLDGAEEHIPANKDHDKRYDEPSFVLHVSSPPLWW